MKSIENLLKAKNATVWSIAPDASVLDAISLMAEKKIGALTVMDGEQLVGMITERDYARKVILQGRSSRQTPVEDIMSRNVVCARPDQQVEECMAVMTARKFRHMPVIVDNKIVGLISLGDLVKVVIQEQQFIIDQLEHYINS